MIILKCEVRFDETNLVGVGLEAVRRGLDRPSTLVLREERSGLLNWMLAGLRRALTRGSIETPAEAKETADEIHRDSNLAAGFIAECTEYDTDRRIAVPDFCAAFSVWWLENKGEDRSIPSNESISRALNALADPCIGSHPKETRDNARRYFCGIRLNPLGRTLWERAFEAKAFEGKLASITSREGEVNSYIPNVWDCRLTVQRMRAAQAAKKELSRADLRTVTSPRTVTERTVTKEPSLELSPFDPSSTQPPDPSGESEF